MMVVIHTGSYSALTALSMTGISSLTEILLVNLISNFIFTFSLSSNRQDDIRFVGRLSTSFVV